ncbi:MAG: LptF/LptG family permease [Gemmatimonadota bacterium]|nr:LptF/LptG family permease [Gemmatimonadota bacterium]
MKILTRYVLREHVGPLLFSLSALTALLLLNQVAKNFGNLVGKGLPWGVIGQFFLLTIPFIVAMTLPMAVLVAVLYAFSRLAAENEITALKASGVSILRLIGPPLWGATSLALLMLAFNDQILPRANHTLRTLESDIARKKPTFALREQVINELSPGKLYLRAGRVDNATALLREVTIWDLSDPMRRRTVYADSGRMGMSKDRRDLAMVLFTGYSQEITRDHPEEMQRLFFTIDDIRVRGVGNQLELTGSKDQYKSDREMSICEMQHVFEQRAVEYASARTDLERAEAAARSPSASAGPSAVPASRPPRLVLGSGYCQAVERLFRVKEAEAAQLPAQTPRDQAPPTSLAIPIASQLSVLRARLTDTQQGMARYQIEIQKKFALAAACMVFVVFGAPIALRFPRGGVGLTIGVSLGAFAIYYVALIAGEALANKVILSPFWAMWMANIFFTAVGAVMLWRVRTSGATARGGDVGELLEGIRGWVRRIAMRGPPPSVEPRSAG